MACLQLTTAMPLRQPEISAGARSFLNATNFIPRKKHIAVAFASSSQESLPAQSENPEIELEFIGPKPGNDGSFPVEKAKAVSGEKLLRNIMLDNKIELYATYGKVMNCGGGGSCGTCIVERRRCQDLDSTKSVVYKIIDGKDLLNERTNTELRYLKKKPESWRLACQTIVGNKENSGKVVVQRIPQRKK